LWVFFHRDLKIRRLPDLRGRKIAIGPEASGTNAIAARLLRANGITPDEVHSGPGLFQDLNEFPSQRYLDFPLHKDAQRYFKSGPPFLKRYLPFWAADFIERAKVMLLPLITLLIPLIRSLPPGFRWRIRSRIYRWYRDLNGVDARGAQSQSPEEIRACLAELDRIEKEVLHVSVPQSYAGELYLLRTHISFVGESLRKREAAFPAGKDTPEE
jgi:hypothetical protein